jgi:hypothetical protein
MFNKNVNLRFTKAKFRFKINEVEKVEIDGETKLKIVDSKTNWCRGSDFERSLREDYSNKVERKIEFCNGEPEIFSLGTLYIRKDGREVYVFNEINSNKEISDITKIET